MRMSVAAIVMSLLPVLASAQTSTGSKPVSFVDSCRPDLNAPRQTLSGKVTDATGAPLVGATIALRCGTFRQDARTTGDGTYRITAPAGSYLIEVEHAGFDEALETLQLSAGSTRDFSLQTGAFSSIITVQEKGGYFAGSSTSATKTDAPLIEIPQSVSVVTEDQLTARNVQTINEAIRYTGSVGVDVFGQETRYDWINIRGFDQSTYGLYRDNSRWQSGNVSGQIDPYMIQEVDIVKGPSSVLYGQNQPGGLVNLVTKRPPSRELREIVLNYGSYNRAQVSADFGGPVGDSSTLKYRLTGLYRDSDTQVKHVPDNRWFLAPGLTWTPTTQTTWTVLADYQKDDTGWSQFLPAPGTLLPNPNGKVAIDTFVGEPDYDFFHRTQWSGGSLFEHRFNEVWTIRNTARYSSIKYDGNTVFGGGLQPDLRTLNRFGFGNSLDLGLFTMDTNGSAHVKSGIVDHSVLFGVDYSHSQSEIVSAFASAPTIDVFEPQYGAAVPALFTYQHTKQPLDLLGIYLQDHMKIGPRWVLTAAARHDSTKLKTEDLLFGANSEQSPDKVTGRVGVTYLSEIGLAPYASWSTSFLPTSGVDASGKPFVPTEGKQVEGGLKFQPKGSNSFLTADYFQITQTNVLSPDPDHQFQNVQQGEIRSRGYELEAVGNVVSTLNFNAAYSHLDQEVTRTTDPTALHKRPAQVPDDLFSLGGEYTVANGALTGLGFGAGVRYVGSSAGDAANTIEVPSYTLFDASVRYLFNNVEFQLSGTNLTNKEYVAVCQSVNYCNYGTARKFIATTRFHF